MAEKRRDYAIYDVFCEERLKGNPLAVVFDADGLSDEAMQRIAGEFNLSETVFVLPPAEPRHSARIRIFTIAHELPFAGHPTVGTAIALAERRLGDTEPEIDLVEMIEEDVGPVRCAVSLAPGRAGFCEFDLPRLSTAVSGDLDRAALAYALGLGPHEIGFENHVPTIYSAGVAFVFVPVHDVSAVGRAALDRAAWAEAVAETGGRIPPAYVYTRGGIDHRADFHARMFFSDHDGEDPATGSAAAALSGAVHRFDALLDGHHACLIEQGVEMGRPSHIHLHVDVEKGVLAHARIGGSAVRLAEGRLFV